ncbi:hypothetical protein GIB67_018832 [Kingdonia uniflora]|uniref:SKI-interacting protein SKIP SNW domain-containing protein n=1 Tax=Kingdonia uniflora TaxID=39325 RepID=A0A7J7NEU4_9MAGN|nr:hypothetical protein GIB67_018832 [Kingdonia uniflora]
MAALRDLLPPVRSTTTTYYDHSNDDWFKQRVTSSEQERSIVFAAAKSNPVPPYGKRAGFIPRKPEDFGDGGAFPEIHIGQYPLGMGRKDEKQKLGSKILPLTVDAHGSIAFDAIVKQNENASKIVHSQHRDLVPKILRGDEEEVGDELSQTEKEIDEITQETKTALEKIVNVRLSAAQPKNVPAQSSDSKFIKYKPSQQLAAFNSGAKERIIRMVEMPVDPLEPPKFKHKRVPKASGSPPVPVMHSPPRPVTVKDQQDWKIPPCISNWKNPKGYTIPLDKRLAADGRGLQEVQINDNFAKLSEALYVAEQKAREAVAMRSKVQKEMMLKDKERREQELRAMAQRARSERTGGGGVAPAAAPMPTPSESNMVDGGEGRDDYDRVREREREPPKETRAEREDRLTRDKLREERRRDREREKRLDTKDGSVRKKRKIVRDDIRDISEKIALGQANTASGRGEVMYDQRLFNQEKGMDSGFATDDQYNIYDKNLFGAQATMSTLYKPKKDSDVDMYGGADEQMEKVLKTDRFKADKKFTGAPDKAAPRERPVEFEQEVEEPDPFGLDKFLTEVKKGKKAIDKIGGGGTLKYSAGGSSTRDSQDGGSGRTRIGFEKEGERRR